MVAVDELRKSLGFQVQDFIPMPVDQAILDFHALEEFTNDQGGRMLRVLLVAAARDMVGSAMDAVTKAGLEPAMVDLTALLSCARSCRARAASDRWRPRPSSTSVPA